MPSHVETILNYIHFERRQDPSQFQSLVNSYINSEHLSSSAKAFFTIQYTRYLQQVKKKHIFALKSVRTNKYLIE